MGKKNCEYYNSVEKYAKNSYGFEMVKEFKYYLLAKYLPHIYDPKLKEKSDLKTWILNHFDTEPHFLEKGHKICSHIYWAYRAGTSE